MWLLFVICRIRNLMTVMQDQSTLNWKLWAKIQMKFTFEWRWQHKWASSRSPTVKEWYDFVLSFWIPYIDRFCFWLKGVPVTSLRFLFDGRRINDDETPKQVCSIVFFINSQAINEFLNQCLVGNGEWWCHWGLSGTNWWQLI